MISVMILAGGTGGHIFPGLAVARALRAQDVAVVWLATREGLEAEIVPAAGLGIDMQWIRMRAVRGVGWLRWLMLPFSLSLALMQSLRALRRTRPQAVLSMGGFVAAPGGLAAWLTRTPLLIHEANAVPGLANRLLAPLASRVLVGFPGVFQRLVSVHHVGNPVRPEIAALAPAEARLAGRGGRLRLLVVGGSRGARVFNETLPRALGQLAPNERPEIRHQCGRGARPAVLAAYKASGVEAQVEEFIKDMAAAYQWADVVLCRAGAMTVAELAAAGIASILVPFPHAVDDHQSANARVLADAGAAMLLPQPELTPARLAVVLRELAARRDTLLAMGKAARRCAVADAADTVARHCLEVMNA